MDPAEVLPTLAAEIARVKRDGALLVGIDGIDAAGKTTLACELVPPLETLRRHVVRASLECREQRIAQSPDCYCFGSKGAPITMFSAAPVAVQREHTNRGVPRLVR